MFQNLFVKQLNADDQESAAAPAEATTATTNAPELAPEPAPEPVAVATAHDDFDWSIDKRNVSAYSADEKAKYDKVYDQTFVAITDGELISGLVVGLTKTDVVLNIGFKSDGLVSVNEFRDMPDLKKGDTVDVFVEQREDENGQLVFSANYARGVVDGKEIQYFSDGSVKAHFKK